MNKRLNTNAVLAALPTFSKPLGFLIEGCPDIPRTVNEKNVDRIGDIIRTHVIKTVALLGNRVSDEDLRKIVNEVALLNLRKIHNL